MQNNSQVSTFLLFACTSLSTVFTQVLLATEIPLIGQDNTASTTLVARVVHDPDDGKAPPPS
jgi:hypothetical protein